MFARLPLRLVFAALLFTLAPAQLAAQESAETLRFNEAERYYAAGRREQDTYEKGRYMNHVIGLYVKFLNTYPRSKHAPAARFHLGHARQTLGKVEECKRTYETVISRHKKGSYVGSAARQLAYLAYVEQDWANAAKYFAIAASHLDQENLRHNALTKQVQCLMKLKRSEAVVTALRRIVEARNHPYKDWARFMLGYQYFEAEQYEVALKILAPLLSDDTKSNYRSQALFYTGLAAAELGQDDVAETHLRSILEMPASHPSLTDEQRKHLATNKAKAQTALMGLYTRKKKYDEVVQLYELGDFRTRGKVEARRCWRAGEAYFNLEKYSAARAAYRRVDRALPNTDIAFESSYQCLLCDYQLAHPGLAERVTVFFEFYGKKHWNDKRMQIARFLKAETYYNNRNYEQAATAFNRVKDNDIPQIFLPELLYKRGWSLSESGQHDGAIQSFGRFIADFPEDPRKAVALCKRAQSQMKLGDRASALRGFEAAANLNSSPETTALALQGSARALREDKKYEEMIVRYRRLLSEFQDLPKDTIANANYWIGWGFYQLKKFENVPAYTRKGRELVPEFYSLPVGNILALTAFAQRDKFALHTALQEIFKTAPYKTIPPYMLSWLGVQMFHDGQHAEAADYLQRATDLKKPQKTEIAIWRTLAKAQNKTGLYEEARQTGELLLRQKQEPKWEADAHLDLGEALLGMQDFKTAESTAKAGLALDAPGAHVAGLRLILGEVALQRESWVEALANFELTIEMVPDDPVLQPRALAGGAIAARNLNETDPADRFERKLRDAFPHWKPFIRTPTKEENAEENKTTGVE